MGLTDKRSDNGSSRDPLWGEYIGPSGRGTDTETRKESEGRWSRYLDIDITSS